MKNKMQMAKIFSLGLAAVLVFTGCQKNPDKKVVDGKDAIYSDDNGALSLPDEWKHSFENSSGDVKVKVEAKINVPRFEKITESAVVANVMTKEKANALMQKFFPNSYCVDDSAQYDENMNIIKTKKEIEQLILEAQKDINDAKSGTYKGEAISGEEANRIIKDSEDGIKYLQERYPTAPEEIVDTKLNEIPQKGIDEGGTFYFSDKDSSQKLGDIGFSGGAYENGKAHMVKLFNWSIVKDIPNHYEKPLTISKEDAEKKAKEFIKDNFGVGNLYLGDYVRWINEEGKNKDGVQFGQINAHVFYFVKNYYGLPETYINENDSSLMFEDSSQYGYTWLGEAFKVVVTDFGVFDVSWDYPTKVVEGTEKEVRILPFEKIQQRFEEQSKLTQGWIDKKQGMTAREVIIDDIRLGVMKVKQKDKNEYKMVPVWDFFGYSIETYSEQQEGGYELDANNQYVNKTRYSFMTINAVDGTVIDRKLGY